MSQNYRDNDRILLCLKETLNDGRLRKLPLIGRCLALERRGITKFAIADSKYKFGGWFIESSIGFFLHDHGNCFVKGSKGPHPSLRSTLTICPLMNFPETVKESQLSKGQPRKEWVELILDFLERVPDTAEEATSLFPEGFFNLSRMDRIPIFIQYLDDSH